MTRVLPALAVRAALAAALAAAPAAACPFCAKLGKTLSDWVAEADAVVYGRFVPDSRHATGLAIDAVVKAPPGFPAGTVSLARPLDLAEAGPRLAFLKRQGTRFAATKATALANRAPVDYLTGLTNCRSRRERVAWWFGRLLDAEPEIADDAYKSLAKLYAAELAAERAALDPGVLRGWLRRDDAKPDRAGLLALLLGLCGGREDAEFLADLAARPPARLRPALDGLLGGLCAVDFARGTELALATLRDAAAPLAERQAARSALAFALAELPRVDPAPLLDRALPAAADARLAPEMLMLFRQHAFAGAEPLALRQVSSGLPAAKIAAARFLAGRPSPAARAALAEFRRREPLPAAEAEQAPPFIPDPPRVARR